jgi:riboflavin kinase / FMN adenylyltransferase
MRISNEGQELNLGKCKVCLAIGFFDGVHLGHQQILRQTLSDARQHDDVGIAVTFDHHPNTVVAPTRVPPLIYPLSRKLRAIDKSGMDAALLIHFDKIFSETSGENFIRDLDNRLGKIRSVCVGANFVFGHNRDGNMDLLRRLGKDLDFGVHGIAAVSLDGKPISSTRIRQAILAGDLDNAGQMLGRAYSLTGAVRKGDGLGRKLGFPTANIDTTDLAVPPAGVYAARTTIPAGTFRAVVNIGHRPTLRQVRPELRVEAHLLDFDGELYGAELEVVLIEKLRDERKFESLAALTEQIARDVSEAKDRL